MEQLSKSHNLLISEAMMFKKWQARDKVLNALGSEYFHLMKLQEDIHKRKQKSRSVKLLQIRLDRSWKMIRTLCVALEKTERPS